MYSNHLENLRNELNLTKKELANILGVSNSIYARWEKNTDSIPTRRLIQIANYFNVNIDYILNLTNNKIAIKSNTINYDLIAKRTRELRIDLNMTLREIATFLNTTSSTWSAYETGKTVILSSFLTQICKKYKYSADWVLGRSNNKYLI
ncbi:MAG TPA: helix-turn-helix domain-containing protein [Candidatus Onthocola stercorigallinarum]|nr:helix-turn-helix domain-containing protein [Candidatus Onthocola stercorigallinarum]